MDLDGLFAELGLAARETTGGDLAVTSPIDGTAIAEVHMTGGNGVEVAIARAAAAFEAWRSVPAPRRGELIRLFGEELRGAKDPLGRLVTIETGKILQEGLGEVQEMISTSATSALGLSR